MSNKNNLKERILKERILNLILYYKQEQKRYELLEKIAIKYNDTKMEMYYKGSLKEIKFFIAKLQMEIKE